MCHKIKKFSNGLMNHFPRYWVKIPKFDNYHPPYYLVTSKYLLTLIVYFSLYILDHESFIIEKLDLIVSYLSSVPFYKDEN